MHKGILLRPDRQWMPYGTYRTETKRSSVGSEMGLPPK